jgi:transcriptional regulator with XRE-family HTH domain
MARQQVPSLRTSIYADAGKLIKTAREGKHMTQGRLAAMVGLSRTSITNIERGRQKILLHTLSEIADALGIPLAELLPLTRENRPPLEHKLPEDVSPKEREWITRIVEKGAKKS